MHVQWKIQVGHSIYDCLGQGCKYVCELSASPLRMCFRCTEALLLMALFVPFLFGVRICLLILNRYSMQHRPVACSGNCVLHRERNPYD
jgi:hypothetical protein